MSDASEQRRLFLARIRADVERRNKERGELLLVPERQRVIRPISANAFVSLRWPKFSEVAHTEFSSWADLSERGSAIVQRRTFAGWSSFEDWVSAVSGMRKARDMYAATDVSDGLGNNVHCKNGEGSRCNRRQSEMDGLFCVATTTNQGNQIVFLSKFCDLPDEITEYWRQFW